MEIDKSKHSTQLESGLTISATRYQPATNQAQKEPIMMVHGFISNQETFTLDKEQGIAQEMARNGKDVWAINLRGRDEHASETPNDEWTVQDYAHHDIPAFIEMIKNKTNSPKIHWVGHSMGGMLYFATVTNNESRKKDIKSAITLGSTIDWPAIGDTIKTADTMEVLPDILPVDAIGDFMDVIQDTSRALPGDFFERVSGTSHIPDDIVDETNTAYGDTSPLIAAQFMDWYSRPHINGENVITDQVKRYKEINDTTPVTMINGTDDALAPVSRVRAGKEILGDSGENIKLLTASKDKMAHAYDHTDLIYGHNVQSDIIPVINQHIDRNPIQKNKKIEESTKKKAQPIKA